MAKYFDRYEEFKNNGESRILPLIAIPQKESDVKVEYNSSKRLDIISQDVYNSPYFGWLIMLANPQFGGLEFDIPDNTVLRVPFPLETSLKQYEEAVSIYIDLYGI